MHATHRLRPALLLLAAAFGLAASAAPAADDPASAERARELYDRGAYAEARPLLEQLAAAGQADGPLLYRLAYTQRLASDPAAGETQQRALARLEQEAAGDADLETLFYLFSALGNVARLTDARDAGARALAGVESGRIAVPPTGEGAFWVARLYDDAGKTDKAATWYARAAEAFREAGVRHHVYRTLALRALAGRALAAGKTEQAAGLLAELGRDSDVPIPDLEQIAEDLTAEGKYEAARDVWQTIDRRQPGTAPRASYMWRLAAAADWLGDLPATSKLGIAWSEMSREDLGAALSELVRRVRDAQAEWAGAETATPELRQRLEAEIDAVRRPFVAAALEYGLRRYGLREAAFFGGFSPMIFRADAWNLPERTDGGAAPEAAGETG